MSRNIKIELFISLHDLRVISLSNSYAIQPGRDVTDRDGANKPDTIDHPSSRR